MVVKEITFTCPTCEEQIVEASEVSDGQDAIECEGLCRSWLHRKCAGLSEEAFITATNSSSPFKCPQCRLMSQEEEINELKLSVDQLKSSMSALVEEVRQLKVGGAVNPSSQTALQVDGVTPSPNSSPNSYASVAAKGNIVNTGSYGQLSQQSHPSIQFAFQPPRTSTIHESDRKFNVIVYGVDESEKGKSRFDREAEDLQKALTVFQSLEQNIDSNSIKDHFRLGRYDINQSRSRPVMVKFVRSADVRCILSKCSQLRAPYCIKPDRSEEERKREKSLLGVRWSLILSGIERKNIKLRNSSIYVSGVLYGRLDGSGTFRRVDGDSDNDNITDHDSISDQQPRQVLQASQANSVISDSTARTIPQTTTTSHDAADDSSPFISTIPSPPGQSDPRSTRPSTTVHAFSPAVTPHNIPLD